MSTNKKLKLATPNSSKLAEILLQLKDDSLIQPQVILSDEAADDDFEAPSGPSANTQATATSGTGEDDPVITLPPSEACNCRKSRCLKLYCQCFAGRAICGQYCRCLQCDNRTVTGNARVMAIKNVLERNPNAFESKYKTSMAPESEEVVAPIAHKNGCRCRKSLCLKKYCECFQGGVHCSTICTCLVCYNRNGPPLVVNRTNSLPVEAHSSVLDKYKVFSNSLFSESDLANQSALFTLKRALSEGGALNAIDEQALLSNAIALQALNQRMSLSSNEHSSPSSSDNDHEQNQSKPPLGPHAKKKRMESTPSSAATAALLTLQQAVEALSPNTPGMFSNVSVPLGVETPFTIRSASPNSLSIAKALSLLGHNALAAAAAQNLISIPIAETHESKEVKTPFAVPPAAGLINSQSSTSSADSDHVDSSVNSSMELTDGDQLSESDVTEIHKLGYGEGINMTLATTECL